MVKALRSIPIVEDHLHEGRNYLERSIGCRVYSSDENHCYDEDLVGRNHQLFLAHETLIGA